MSSNKLFLLILSAFAVILMAAMLTGCAGKQAAVPSVEPPAAEAEPPAFENDGQYAAAVDNEGITLDDFVQMAVFNRYQYLNMYNQYAQMYSMYGLPLDSLNEQMEGIVGENGKERLGGEVIDQLTYDKVLELEAAAAGVAVDEEEVYARLREMFGYEDPSEQDNGMLNLESFDIDPTDLDDKEDKNAEFRNYAELVLATSYGGKVSFDFLKDYAYHILLDNKLFEGELSQRVFEEEMVNARHILVDDEEKAKEILARLEAGESWDALASENSLDTANKDKSGALGWFGRGVMVSEFEQAAFGLEPGEISDPVKTSFGYHIIASDGKETRPMEGSALESAQNALYDEWSLGLRDKHEILSFSDVWMEALPMEPAFNPNYTGLEEAAEEEAPAEEELPAEEETAEEEPIAEPEPEEEQPAAVTVNGHPIDIAGFVPTASMIRYQNINNYSQYAQLYAMFGVPLDEINDYFSGILGEEGKENLGQMAANQMAVDYILELEAEKAGITISDAEVTAKLKEMMGYDQQDQPEDAFGVGTFNLAEDEAEDEAFVEEAKNAISMAFGEQVSYEFYREYVRHGMIETALVEKNLEGRVFEEEMVNARHILVEDEDTAIEILAKLEAGEDWNALAAEHSLDTANKDDGGALGWFGRGMMVPEFEEAAFALEPGQISEPVQTSYGYHIIASDGKEIRPMEEAALETARNTAAEEWYQELIAGYDIQTNKEVWLPLVPMEPAFEPLNIQTDGEDGSGIPTFSIGTQDEAETDEAEPEAEEDLSIDNTEQDDDMFLLDNSAETNE